ncbi:hypothetical protein P43SY_008488 [Pythium insidiosum]|uniref:THO complex subunit 5 n=1 Tax=Pythium insidiosum TaxID=114742 RepID=A0AAD5QAR4_PYTIN|nr:hypothetical protein P43SY_008488 [Pythium insidiosum]
MTESRVAPLRELKQASESLRKILTELEAQHRRGKIDQAQLKAERWRVLVLLRAVKAGLRDTFLAADAWKTRVQEQKDVVDAHQLRLQNLLYEKDHLLREIRRCRGFHTKEMDKIEFEGGAIPIDVSPDVHRQHLDQLTKELETRKRMMADVKELRAKIEVVEATTQRKQAFLDGLRGELDRIDASTRGLQHYMRRPVSATLKLQQDASLQLPTPLYTLFCELESYQNASGCAAHMALAIVDARGLRTATHGSLVLRVTKRSFPNALMNGGRLARGSPADEAEADDASGPSRKRQKGPSRSPSVAPQDESDKRLRAPSRSPSTGRSRASDSVEANDAVGEKPSETALTTNGAVAKSDTREEIGEVKPQTEDDHDAMDLDGDAAHDQQEDRDLWRCSEKALQLQLSLAVDDDATGSATTEFTLLFQHFPHAKLVTVELVTPANLPKQTLMNLFPGDDGRQLPDGSTVYRFKDTDGKEVSFPVDKVACHPFHWAQWICGLYTTQRGLDESRGHHAETSVRNTMEQLIKRLTTTVQLQRHLLTLTKAPSGTAIPVHASLANIFGSQGKTKVTAWKELTTPSSSVINAFGEDDRTFSRHGCRYFSASLTSGHDTVEAMIEVAPEYPIRAPRFRLRHKANATGDAKSAIVDNHLKEIEIEVNTFYDELTTPACSAYLLAHQLKKVMHCLDVVREGGAGQLPRCFGRERRGKDRRPALVVDSVTREARHR